MAANGKGVDEPTLDDPAKVKLRGQALDWLKSELNAWSSYSNPARPENGSLFSTNRLAGSMTGTWPVFVTRQSWQTTPEERGGSQFWADFAAKLKQANAKHGEVLKEELAEERKKNPGRPGTRLPAPELLGRFWSKNFGLRPSPISENV